MKQDIINGVLHMIGKFSPEDRQALFDAIVAAHPELLNKIRTR